MIFAIFNTKKTYQSHQLLGKCSMFTGQITISPKPELRALSAQMFGCIHLVHINSASDSGDSEYTIHPPTSSCCFATLAFENTGAGHWNLGPPQCQMKPHEPFGPKAPFSQSTSLCITKCKSSCRLLVKVKMPDERIQILLQCFGYLSGDFTGC